MEPLEGTQTTSTAELNGRFLYKDKNMQRMAFHT